MTDNRGYVIYAHHTSRFVDAAKGIAELSVRTLILDGAVDVFDEALSLGRGMSTSDKGLYVASASKAPYRIADIVALHGCRYSRTMIDGSPYFSFVRRDWIPNLLCFGIAGPADQRVGALADLLGARFLLDGDQCGEVPVPLCAGIATARETVGAWAATTAVESETGNHDVARAVLTARDAWEWSLEVDYPYPTGEICKQAWLLPSQVFPTILSLQRHLDSAICGVIIQFAHEPVIVHHAEVD